VPEIPTPSQTAGPFVHIGTSWLADEAGPAPGEGAIEVTGTVVDGAGAPVTDAMIEFWQADEHGLFPPESPPGWKGFARLFTDPAGRFRLVTRKPGPVAGEAPHLDVSIFARGLLQRLVTRIYFPDEAANATDPVLAGLPAELRERLVAQPSGTPATAHPVYHFDVHLQGDRETVFFGPW
jgi:protocatechuate 3,4-dioxygenase alpha subunit